MSALPQRRTSLSGLAMSALCQKRKSGSFINQLVRTSH